MPPISPKKKLTIDETELVSLLKTKDKRGFDILYHNYAGALYGLINRLVESEILAKQLLQTSFHQIWHTIDQYDASKTSLFTWMHAIVRNLALNPGLPLARHESPLTFMKGDLSIAN